MRLLRRKKPLNGTEREAKVAHEEATERLRQAQARRDKELVKLRREQRTLVTPLQETISANHFADLIRQSLQHLREDH